MRDFRRGRHVRFDAVACGALLPSLPGRLRPRCRGALRRTDRHLRHWLLLPAQLCQLECRVEIHAHIGTCLSRGMDRRRHRYRPHLQCDGASLIP